MCATGHERPPPKGDFVSFGKSCAAGRTNKLCHPSNLSSPLTATQDMIPFFFLFLSVFTSATAAYTWPSPQYDALEQLLFEGTRSDGSSLASIVNPCRKRTGTLASIAAEWLRFVGLANHFPFSLK
jgi:hypothetical protein